MNRALVGIGLVLLLSGCGSSASPPLPTSTTVSAVLTHEQAAQRYLAIVAPWNTAADAFQVTDLDSVHTQSRVLADASSQFLRDLTTTPWPADVAGDVQNVETSVGAMITPLRRMQSAETLSEAEEAYSSVSLDRSAVQVLRAKLGLSEVR